MKAMFGAIVTAAVVGQHALAAVTVQLRVVVIDKSGERPWADAWVGVFPKDQGVTDGFTDAEGNIAFSFEPTESVVFRVGSLTKSVPLAPLSGRISQTTSYLDDRRHDGARYATTCSATWNEGPVLLNDDELGVLQIIDTIRTQAGGRLMDDQSRDYTKRLRDVVARLTTPADADSPEERDRKAAAKRTLLQAIESLLQSPWRMGATVQRTDGGYSIVDLVANGPAKQAGAVEGDLITHVNAVNLGSSSQTLTWLIANSETDRISLIVNRADGSTATINVALTR